jgi:hypothetical protein
MGAVSDIGMVRLANHSAFGSTNQFQFFGNTIVGGTSTSNTNCYSIWAY